MAEVQALQDEIYRIVTSPYPVSLKHLLDLVQGSDPLSIQQWADAKPCQIEALAAAVLEGLPRWEYIFDILEPLIKIVPFRNAILLQSPLLLDTLLTKAIQGAESRQKYSGTCVSLLSHPLPDDAPMPASIHEFFRQSVELMASSPSAGTCRPVYNLLCGIGPAVLHTFPPETMVRFKVESLAIIGGTEAANPHQAAIPLCLASLARIARNWVSGQILPRPGPAHSAQSHLGENNWLRGILDIFCFSRALKTLDIVLSRTVMACSNTMNGQIAGSREEILLAIDTLESVERSRIKSWMRTKSGLLGKLETKIKYMDSEPELKAAALSFLISLYDAEEVPPTTIAACWQLIAQCIRADRLDCARPLLKHSAFQKDENFLSHVDENMVQCILRAAMKVAFEEAETPYTLVNQIPSFALLVKSVDAAQKYSAKVREIVLDFISMGDVSRDWHNIILRLMNNPPQKCGRNEVCDVALRQLQKELMAALSCLFLASRNLPTEPDPEDPMTRLMAFEHPPLCCLTLSSRALSHPSILEVGLTPERNNPSHDWRGRLAKDLLRDASRTHQSIERVVGEICRDLEDRCENVEQPLRKALKKQKEAEAELEAAKGKVNELESQNAENVSKISTYETERTALEQAFSETQGKLHALNGSLLNAQGLAAVAQEDAARVVKKAQDQIECDRLYHAGRDLGRESVLDGQQRAIAQLEDRLKDAEHHFKEIMPLLESKDAELFELRACKRESLEKVSTLTEDKKELSAKIDRLTSELNQSREDTQAAHLKLQKAREDRSSEVEQLKEAHQSELTSAAEEASRTMSLKDQQIDDLNSAFTEAETDVTAQLREKDATISSFQAKCKKLEAKAKSLAELERVFVRLIGSNSSTSMETPRPQRCQSHGMSLGHTSGTGVTRGSDDSPPKGFIGGLDIACGSSSSSNAGPTPKRPKARPTAPPSSKRTVRFSSFPGGLQSRGSRRPLEESAVGNRGKTPVRSGGSQRRKSGGTQLVPSMTQMGLGNLEDISFSDGSIFTSSRSEKTGVDWKGEGAEGVKGLPRYEIEDEAVDEL